MSPTAYALRDPRGRRPVSAPGPRAGGAGGRMSASGGVGPPRPARSAKRCESGEWVTEPDADVRPPATGPVRSPAALTGRTNRKKELELDELGENDIGHRANLVKRNRRHRVIEVQHRHCAPPTAF